jgi:hypothetical protein
MWQVVTSFCHLHDVAALAGTNRELNSVTRQPASYDGQLRPLLIPLHELHHDQQSLSPGQPVQWMVCKRRQRRAEEHEQKNSYHLIRQLFFEHTGRDAGASAEHFARMCMSIENPSTVGLPPWYDKNTFQHSFAMHRDERTLLRLPPADESSHSLARFRTHGFWQDADKKIFWWRRNADGTVTDGLRHCPMNDRVTQLMGIKAWWMWTFTSPMPQTIGAFPLPTTIDENSAINACMHASIKLLGIGSQAVQL